MSARDEAKPTGEAGAGSADAKPSASAADTIASVRRRPRGPTDPDRRERIAEAALAVALERGVGGVSHRAVAAAAGVPLGSTTYHFRGLDDLLAAAMERAARRYAEQLVAWSAAIPEGGDIADALCEFVIDGLLSDHERIVAEYELYFASLRRPALHDVSRAWLELLTLVLTQHVDEVTARELTIVADGVMVNALVTGTPPRRADLYELLRKVVG